MPGARGNRSQRSRLSDEAHRIDIHVGKQMHQHRIAACLSQAELGKHLGISFQQVQKYEKGLNRISGGRLFLLARFFGVNIDSFFNGIEPPSRVEANPALDPDTARVLAFAASREGLRLNLAYLDTAHSPARKLALHLLQFDAKRDQMPEGIE